MNKEIKNIALPINKIEYSKSNKNLIKCTIYVMHIGENLNCSSFSEESVLKAKESLKNVPILANIDHDKDYNPTDFGGHDMDLHIIERANGDHEFKTVYIEKPVGVIPETNNYRIETLENGEKWVVVEGYIWKEYSDSHELLTRTDKKVSMEISVDSGFFDDNFMYHIESYEYLGVTILGDNYPPAMGENAIISLFNNNEDIKVEYTKLLEEVKNFEEGGNEVEDFKKKRKCSKCEAEYEVSDNFSEDEEFICDSCKEENTFSKKTTIFELSFDDIREKLYGLIKKEDCYCWIVETFTDKFIYVNETWEDDKYECRYYKQGYEMDNEDIKLVGDSIEVFAEFLTQEEIDKLNEEKQSYTNNIETLKAENYDLQTKFGELDTEVKSLREYKAEIEQAKFEAEETNRKKSIDSELEEFSELSSCDGYKEIMDKKYEVEVEKSKILLKALAYDNGVILGKKKNFSKKDKTVVTIPIENIHVDIEKDPYDGILDKYINK